MSIGTALGNAIAGYRDRDNKRCAAGLADVVSETSGLREDRDALLRAVSLAIHELNYHHPERALEVLKSARAARRTYPLRSPHVQES
jgi:hypothetical protein